MLSSEDRERPILELKEKKLLSVKLKEQKKEMPTCKKKLMLLLLHMKRPKPRLKKIVKRKQQNKKEKLRNLT